MKDIKLVKHITDWNSIGIRTNGRIMERWSNEWFKEDKTEKLDPAH